MARPFHPRWFHLVSCFVGMPIFAAASAIVISPQVDKTHLCVERTKLHFGSKQLLRFSSSDCLLTTQLPW